MFDSLQQNLYFQRSPSIDYAVDKILNRLISSLIKYIAVIDPKATLRDDEGKTWFTTAVAFSIAAGTGCFETYVYKEGAKSPYSPSDVFNVNGRFEKYIDKIISTLADLPKITQRPGAKVNARDKPLDYWDVRVGDWVILSSAVDYEEIFISAVKRVGINGSRNNFQILAFNENRQLVKYPSSWVKAVIPQQGAKSQYINFWQFVDTRKKCNSQQFASPATHILAKMLVDKFGSETYPSLNKIYRAIEEYLHNFPKGSDRNVTLKDMKKIIKQKGVKLLARRR